MSTDATMSAENFISQSLGDLGVSNEPVPQPPAAQAPAVQAPVAAPAPVAAAAPPPVAAPVVAPPATPMTSLAGLAAAALAANAGEPLPPTGEPPADAGEEIPPEAAGSDRSRNAWTRIKRENRELAAKLAEREAALKTGSTELTEKVTRLTEQLAEYEDKIGRLDLTQSKTFRDKYEAPIAALRNKSSQVLMRFTGRTAEEAASVIKSIESAPMEDVRQMLAEEPAAVQGALLQNLIEAQEYLSVRDRAVEDWRNTKVAGEAGKTKDEEAEIIRQSIASTNDALKKLAATPEDGGEGSWIYQDQPENPEWQDQKTKLQSMARTALRDRTDIPKLVLEGVAAPVYRKLAEQLYAQVTELQRAVDSRDRVRPRVSGRAPAQRRESPMPTPSNPSDFVESMLNE